MLPLFSQTADLYQQGQDQYRAAEYEKARNSFETFIANQEESVKADDAVWYLGRIYRNTGLTEKSIHAFTSVLADETSNRRTEALYDLLKMYDALDREEEISGIAVPVIFSLEPDKYFNKAVPVLLKGYFLAGLRLKGDRLGIPAERTWQNGLEVADRLLEMAVSDEAAVSIFEYRIKFALRIGELRRDPSTSIKYFAMAETFLEMLKRDYPDAVDAAFKLESDIIDARLVQGSLDYSVYAGGGYDALLAGPGGIFDLSLSGSLPLGFSTSFDWDGNYSHDPFSLKTFNFPVEQAGDERLVQTEDSFDASVGISWGSKYFLEQSISLKSGMVLAEDAGDSNYSGRFRHELDMNISDTSRIGTDTSLSAVIYPDYDNAGNKIDYAKFSFSPYFRKQMSRSLYLDLDYSFFWKYYFDAHFDTRTGATDPDTRQYLSNGLAAELGGDILPGLSASLKMETEYLKSYNYDLLVSGLPADQFIADYFDYLRYGIATGISYKKDRIRTGVNAQIGLRTFLNYPVRDELQNFTGDTRQDTLLEIDWENRYVLVDSDAAGRVSLVLDFFLKQSDSNHTYEEFYATNYSNWGVILGVEWKD